MSENSSIDWTSKPSSADETKPLQALFSKWANENGSQAIITIDPPSLSTQISEDIMIAENKRDDVYSSTPRGIFHINCLWFWRLYDRFLLDYHHTTIERAYLILANRSKQKEACHLEDRIAEMEKKLEERDEKLNDRIRQFEETLKDQLKDQLNDRFCQFELMLKDMRNQ